MQQSPIKKMVQQEKNPISTVTLILSSSSSAQTWNSRYHSTRPNFFYTFHFLFVFFSLSPQLTVLQLTLTVFVFAGTHGSFVSANSTWIHAYPIRWSTRIRYSRIGTRFFAFWTNYVTLGQLHNKWLEIQSLEKIGVVP